MNLTVEFGQLASQVGREWQLGQEVNVLNEQGEVIAKAEIELLTLNKHRDAKATYQLLADEATDWEIPLNLYFKKQNLVAQLCEQLQIEPTNKAQTHILLEAISVLPEYRNKGVARYLLQAIAKQHAKVQSITVFSLAMNAFVDADNCETAEDKSYYSQLNLADENIGREQLSEFFGKTGFVSFEVPAEQLVEPLAFDIFVASLNSILAD